MVTPVGANFVDSDIVGPPIGQGRTLAPPADNRPMVRPTQLIHPRREPAPVQAAATLLLLRDTPDGIEVLMTRRSDTASFAPSAYVFPGGRIDAGDAAALALALGPFQFSTRLRIARPFQSQPTRCL